MTPERKKPQEELTDKERKRLKEMVKREGLPNQGFHLVSRREMRNKNE